MNLQVTSPKGLRSLLKKHSGRSARGMITVRSQGGRHKRYYREIDFKRNKFNVEGEVMSLDYDPNRNVEIALIKYIDGDFRYILAPKGLILGTKIMSAEKAEPKVGNAMKLKNLTIGTLVHNVELKPGIGGQIGRSAGTTLQILEELLRILIHILMEEEKEDLELEERNQ